MAKEKKMVEAITSMDEDFAQWYTDIVKKAELSDGEVLLIDIHLDVLPCGILEEVIPKNNPYFLYKFFL